MFSSKSLKMMIDRFHDLKINLAIMGESIPIKKMFSTKKTNNLLI